MAEQSERSARNEWVPIKPPAEGWSGGGLIQGTGRRFRVQQEEDLIVTLELKLSRPETESPTLPVHVFDCLLNAQINSKPLDPKDPRYEVFQQGLIGYFNKKDFQIDRDWKRFRQVWRVPVHPGEQWTIWFEADPTITKILPDSFVGYWLTRLGPPEKIPPKSRRVADSELPR